MQQHVARAGSIWAVVGSDDSVEAEDRLDRIALEPLVEHVAGGAGEKLDEVALPFEVERTQTVSDFGGVHEGAELSAKPLPRLQIGRRVQRERTQHIRQAFETRLVSVEPSGVVSGKLGHLVFRPPRAHLQIAPVGQGQEIRQRAFDDAEPMTIKLKVADDCRVQKRDGVGGDRIAEAGVKFLGDRRAADLCAPLEHGDFKAGHGEIGRRDEAIVTAADHDDVRHQGAGGGAGQRPSSGASRHLLPEGEGNLATTRDPSPARTPSARG